MSLQAAIAALREAERDLYRTLTRIRNARTILEAEIEESRPLPRPRELRPQRRKPRH
jgi:hypothetical protein